MEPIADGGGEFGLFYTAVSLAQAASDECWIFGLQQNAAARSNLALTNTGTNGGSLKLAYEVFDGLSGARKFSSSGVTLGPGAWVQINSVLEQAGVSQGYVRVWRLEGDERFLAYGVLNDGATQTAGTNDGSYISMSGVQ
jgi:hypothetical protein